MSTLGLFWSRVEKRAPEKTAVVDGENRITYRQLGDAIRWARRSLGSRWGVQPGDVVAILAPNCAEFVVSYFAITGAGAAVQPIDERLTPDEIKAALLDSSARFLIVHRDLAPKFDKIRRDLPPPQGILGIRYAPGAHWRFTHPEYSVEYAINAHGFRNAKEPIIPKPKETTRVLLLGDSFTFGQGANHEECPQHGCRPREQFGAGPGAERGLAARSSERRGDVSATTLLEHDDDQQQQTDDDVGERHDDTQHNA